MPYSILKKEDKFVLKNKSTGKVIKKKYASRASAKKAGDNMHRYSTRKKKKY